MAGNVLELTTSSLRAGELVIRGGGYYFFRTSERVTNRELFLSSARSAHVGFRVCADADAYVRVTERARPADVSPAGVGPGGA
jgi:formylglycine-generating enzyme required for sulfatase activity